MLAIILCVFRFVRLLGAGQQAVAVENLALRLQLAAYQRKRKRPVAEPMGSRVLGCSFPGLEPLASRAHFRSTGYSGALATRTFSAILGPDLETDRSPPGKTGRC